MRETPLPGSLWEHSGAAVGGPFPGPRVAPYTHGSAPAHSSGRDVCSLFSLLGLVCKGFLSTFTIGKIRGSLSF